MCKVTTSSSRSEVDQAGSLTTSVPPFSPLHVHEVWVSQTFCRPTLRQHPTTGHRCVATIDAAERTVGLHTNRVIWIVGLSSYRLTGRDCCRRRDKTSHNTHAAPPSFGH